MSTVTGAIAEEGKERGREGERKGERLTLPQPGTNNNQERDARH